LVDELSSSSAEEFAGAMQAMGRAAVVGERTPGIVLVAEVLPLSSGDTLIYPTARTVTSDGITLEGRGVTPDIMVRHTVDALLAGRDLPLEAAIRYLRMKGRE
jgi:carboxyl-terminal processing protease